MKLIIRLYINANPSGNGTDEIIMALTAGTLDFESYDASQSYMETIQDGICVGIYSNSTTDNNINNWFFGISGKKGNVRTSTGTTSQIYANSAISNYYIRLERTANGMTQLSVFSDPTFTTHLPGSPITFAIDPTITGLNTVQHGTAVCGWTTRLINAIVDNDLICDDSSINTCSSIVLSDDFSSTVNWQSQGNGDVNINNGKCNFHNVYCGSYNRVYRNLGTTFVK